MLQLPYVLRLNGWVEGFLLIILGAFGKVIAISHYVAGCWSLLMIAESAIKAKVMNYSQLAEKVGGKALERFLQVNILISMFGACISY